MLYCSYSCDLMKSEPEVSASRVPCYCPTVFIAYVTAQNKFRWGLTL